MCLRYHTTSFAQHIRDGIANDAHTFRQSAQIGKIDSVLESIYGIFGIDYDPDDELYSGPNFENANFTNANFQRSVLIDSKMRFANLQNVDFSNAKLIATNF